MSNVTVELRNKIQHIYSFFLEGKKLRSRQSQKLMIAGIANNISTAIKSDSSVVYVVEAGTGTGKTIAYLAGALLFALQYKLKLIVSTSTINLQNQLLQKDLPDLKKFGKIDFSYALIKGRGRYTCNAKLFNILADNANSSPQLFDEDATYSKQQLKLYRKMNEAITDKLWDGDRDNWSEAVDHRDWRELTVEGKQCTGKKCEFFDDCFFFKARKDVVNSDCIVANHDILLADMQLGGGKLLPPFEHSFIIIDEAHHLTNKCRQHFSATLSVYYSGIQLEKLQKTWSTMAEQTWVKFPMQALKVVESQSSELLNFWDKLERDLKPLLDAEQYYRFDNQAVPKDIVALFREPMQIYTDMLGALELLLQYFEVENPHIDDKLRRYYFNSNAALSSVLEQHLSLIKYYVSDDIEVARWVECRSEKDFLVCKATPLVVGKLLEKLLWSKAKATVLTSATLRALGSFHHLQNQLHLPRGTECKQIDSPFDYNKQARVHLFEQECDPSDYATHCQSIFSYIDKVLDPSAGNLVLFTQEQQMIAVHQLLSLDWRKRVLCQNTLSRDEIIRQHKSAIDSGSGSTIFGLASFSEGVDLPGNYCTHVVLAKLPFAVPKDPIEESLQQWSKQRGDNPFATISLPNASLKLIQATGRLLRSEQDSGDIAICDQRILTKYYGQQLLKSLPPFKVHRHQSVNKIIDCQDKK